MNFKEDFVNAILAFSKVLVAGTGVGIIFGSLISAVTMVLFQAEYHTR